MQYFQCSFPFRKSYSLDYQSVALNGSFNIPSLLSLQEHQYDGEDEGSGPLQKSLEASRETLGEAGPRVHPKPLTLNPKP